MSYRRLPPREKKANKKVLCAHWNPSNQIEELYDHLEDCFVRSIITQPPFIIDQMIDRVLMTVKETVLFEMAVFD